MTSREQRRVLRGALHPGSYLPVALGVGWCAFMAFLALDGALVEHETGLAVIGGLGVVAGLLSIVPAFVDSRVTLTSADIRINRRKTIAWSDITAVQVEVVDADAWLFSAWGLDIEIPRRRVCPVLDIRHSLSVRLDQLGQRVSERGLRRLARSMSILAAATGCSPPDIPPLEQLRARSRRTARPRRAR